MSRFTKILLKKFGPYFILLVIIIISLFFIKNDIVNKSAQILQQRQDLAFKSNSINSLAALRAEYETAKTYLDFLENILPPRDQIITFSKDMESLAKANKLGFDFKFGGENFISDSEPRTVDFRASMQGSYEGFVNFLRGVEKSKYFVNFSSVEISKSSRGYNIGLNGIVFSQ